MAEMLSPLRKCCSEETPLLADGGRPRDSLRLVRFGRLVPNCVICMMAAPTHTSTKLHPRFVFFIRGLGLSESRSHSSRHSR